MGAIEIVCVFTEYVIFADPQSRMSTTLPKNVHTISVWELYILKITIWNKPWMFKCIALHVLGKKKMIFVTLKTFCTQL